MIAFKINLQDRYSGDWFHDVYVSLSLLATLSKLGISGLEKL